MSNVKKNHEDLLKSGQIKLVVGDGRQGHAQNGPYHAIHVGAAAPSLPQAVSLLHAIASSDFSWRLCTMFLGGKHEKKIVRACSVDFHT